MAAMTGGELTGEKVSTMWYEEEGSYNYNSPGFNSSTGVQFFIKKKNGNIYFFWKL